MAYDFKSESEVKDFLHNIGVEYRFGCYSEKNPEACHLLGDYLEAVKKDYEKASKVYKSNCDDLNFGKSCLKYGTFSLLGKGGVKTDFKAAYRYFEKACELQVHDACFNQGLLLLTSSDKCEVETNVPKAFSLLETGCVGKNANACYYLSGLYITGVKNETKATGNKSAAAATHCMHKDMAKAFKYASMGCNLGNIYCCVNLSQMYAKGEGVEKNEALADKYKKLALEMQEEATGTSQTLNFQEGLT